MLRASAGQAIVVALSEHEQTRVLVFHYVYILASTPPGHYYVGLTLDLAERLKQHNRGRVGHTAKRAEWHIQTAIAFRNRQRAAAFERYLKSGSGRAFTKRHF